MSIAQLMRTAAAGVGGGSFVSEVFSSDSLTGNDATQSVTNDIDLSGFGGMVWTKKSSAAYSHGLFDSLRGRSKSLRTDSSGVEQTAPDDYDLVSFNSDGFTVGPYWVHEVNKGGDEFSTQTFRRSERFFDALSWTGNEVSGRSIPHILGVKPGLIIIKKTAGTGNWSLWHRSYPDGIAYLNLTTAVSTPSSAGTKWGSSTNAALNLTDNSSVDNQNGQKYVAYLFAHDEAEDGIIQCGSYTGNSSTTGPIVDLGWEPQYVIIKRMDSTGDWWIYDAERDATNPRTNKLIANSSAAEDTSGEDIDFTSTGFQPKTTATGINASGGNYVYVAIRAEGV